MSFTRTWTVRFSDTDPFGIAHYPRMIDAVHETSDMFMESVGWPFWELIGEHDVGLPVVSMDFDFHGQIGAGDDVEIQLTADVGESSVRFDYEATHDGEVVFSGTEHRVCVPVDGDSGVSVPDELRAALEGDDYSSH
jgi:4-hydroxybenzoyl-CoA thioesterase